MSVSSFGHTFCSQSVWSFWGFCRCRFAVDCLCCSGKHNQPQNHNMDSGERHSQSDNTPEDMPIDFLPPFFLES